MTSPFDPASILNAFVSVAVVFFTLPGVASLSISVTNILKVVFSWFKWSFDSYSGHVAAGLSLALFIALVYFRVIRPDLSLIFLDERAGVIAQSFVILGGFFTQLLMQRPIYEGTKGKIPVVTASYSEAAPGTTVAEVSTEQSKPRKGSN